MRNNFFPINNGTGVGNCFTASSLNLGYNCTRRTDTVTGTVRR
jgi:hypothetical protein